MEEARYSATQIADWFLAENKRRMIEEDSDYITNLKLQKLLYYAQGVFLAILDRPAFEEKIYAWEHGPVVEEIYHQYKRYKASGIDEDIKSDLTKINVQDSALLKQVFDVFAIYSAWKLREMTHQEDPWKQTPRNDVIDLNLIKTFFKKTYIED